jgi:FAD/FMN-containing dehydrogenase
MKGVRVDPTERTAWFEAGVTWEQVIHKAAPYGLAPLNGSAPFVGAVSYTLGGGLGVLGRKYGYAADHVRQLDVVLADGRSIQVDAERQPDLFWGLRGDKGNLGVVTSMEIDLMPVARIYGGGLYFSADATSDVLHAYARWTETVPEEMVSSVALGTFPDIGNMPEPLRGRFVTHVRLAYLGTAAAADRIIRPLRQAARPLMDTVQDIPYTLMGSIHNDPQDPLPVVNSTMMLRELEHHTVETLLALAGPAANAPFGVEIRHLGGALARPPKIPNAVGCRDAAFSLYAGSILDPDYAEVIRDSQQALVDRLRPWATGAEVLNFIHGANTTVERVRAAYRPADYDRLAALKAVYDPHNTFRFNHNIPPAARQASRQVEIG